MNILNLFITRKNYKKIEAFYLSYIYRIPHPPFFKLVIHKTHAMPLAFQQPY